MCTCAGGAEVTEIKEQRQRHEAPPAQLTELQSSEAAGVGGEVQVTCDLVQFQVVLGILQAELPLIQDQLNRLNPTLSELERNTWSITGDIYHMIS